MGARADALVLDLQAPGLLGVPPEQMLVLEDTQTGTRAGAAAGAFVVSVPHEHTATHDFSLAKYVATGLDDPFVIRLVQGRLPSQTFLT